MNAAVTEVPGIRGTELTREITAQLPPSAPAAPWSLRATSLVWFGRPPRAAAMALPHGITGRPRAVGGMFVSYEETPVGPYDEIIGFVALQRGWRVVGHIPFIAVDSAASVVGGRANWSLPKTLAGFSGRPEHRSLMRAQHDDWEVAAQARALGPSLPARAGFTLVQGVAERERRSHGRARIRFRPAVVRVRTKGPAELTEWLRPGRYPGMIIERFAGELDAALSAAPPRI